MMTSPRSLVAEAPTMPDCRCCGEPAFHFLTVGYRAEARVVGECMPCWRSRLDVLTRWQRSDGLGGVGDN